MHVRSTGRGVPFRDRPLRNPPPPPLALDMDHHYCIFAQSAYIFLRRHQL